MGNNQAWLQIRAASFDEVEAAVIASYERRGARDGGRAFDANLPERWSLPGGALPTTIGVAIRPSREPGWLTISDSLRYTSDARLAEDLAGRLATSVFRFDMADIVDSFMIERFGIACEVPRRLDLDDYRRTPTSETRFLVFDGVADYDPDPRVVLDTPCPRCGLHWAPGSTSVPSRPERLVELHPDRAAQARPRLVFRWECQTIDVRTEQVCTGAGWATGVIDHGLLTELHATEDVQTEDVDVALADQVELIRRSR